MKAYVEHLPVFFLVVLLGVVFNLLNQYRKDKKAVNTRRILEEIFGSLWISIVFAGMLDYFTSWSTLLISGLSSLAGYFHSKFIDIVGKDIMTTLGKSVSEYIKKKFNSYSNESKNISEGE